MALQDVGRDPTFGTYRVAGLPEVDFDAFHRDELPARLDGGVNQEVAWDVEGRAPIALGLPDGRAYSYRCRNGRVAIEPGIAGDADTVLEIVDHESWLDYLYEFRTRYGLLYSNAVRFVRGDFDSWDDWEPAIRCMYSGRPIYDPASLDLRDRDGRPLDLERSFELDDDPEVMSHFLRTTGYLVVRRAFDPSFIAELASEVDRIRGAARDGELRSWWASDADGRRFPYRLTYLSDLSETIAGLYEHPRVKQLIALSKEQLVPVPDRIEGILAVIKDADLDAAATAYANLPYHTDCGFGACHTTCPCVLAGIQLDGMNTGSSQLHIMAGSWGKACHNVPADITPERYPLIAIETEPGDATVHYGCGLHAGPPPTGPGRRRTLYLQHYSPRALDLIGPYQGYNQIMPGYGKGDIPNIDEVQQRRRDGN
ncbi:MAG: phytanoyl-CoA dioxygenase family protein [Myxococcota bacterium]|nr:phytanoyl-CoA dioxygenase family protein [Myxococcota bacterium]